MKGRQKQKNKGMEGVWEVLPILVFMAIVPLVMRASIVKIPVMDVPWDQASDQYVDIFAYHKSRLILLSAVWAAGMFAWLVVRKQIVVRWTASTILLCTLGGLVILSYVFSPYKDVALWGYKNRMEGTLVWLSYIWMAFYTMHVIRYRMQLKWIGAGLVGSAGLLGLLGLFQLLGMDPFRTDWGLRAILSRDLLPYIDTMNVNFKFETSRVYMTLYNPNFVGVYCAMITVFAVGIAGTLDSWWKRIAVTGVIGLMVLSLVGSYSRAGLLGLAGTVPFYLILFRKQVFKKPLVAGGVIIGLIGLAIAGNAMTDNVYGRRIQQAFDTTPVENKGLQDIRMDGSRMEVVYGEHTLTVAMDAAAPEKGCVFQAEDQSILEPTPVEESQTVFKLDHEGLKPFTFEYLRYKNQLVLQMTIKGKPWNIALTDQGFRYLNYYGNTVVLENAPSIGFDGLEHFASNRGYMWSRTLPTLTDNWLVGDGADTYALQFPQTDYVMKEYAYRGRRDLVVDRPHNLYLQWVSYFGVLFVIIVLAVTCFQLYKIEINAAHDQIAAAYGKAAMLAVISFLIAGLFNDSSVHIGILPWGMLGLTMTSIVRAKNS